MGVLERFLSEGDKKGYLLREKVRLPGNVTLELHGRKHVLFIKTDEDGRFFFLDIVESSICEAFEDFAASIVEMEEVCTPKEQRKFVEALLQEYGNLKSEHSS